MPNFATTHQKRPPRIAHANESSVAGKKRGATKKAAVAAQRHSSMDSMSAVARERARRVELAGYLIAEQCGFAKGIAHFDAI